MLEHDKLKAVENLSLDTSLASHNGNLEEKSPAPASPSLGSTEHERQSMVARKLELQIQAHSVPLIPIHRLPCELLARIFLIAFESRPKSDYESRPEAISHVCARWRNLSLSLPELWCRINLPFIRVIDESLVVRGKVFASRAHTLPLDVCLYAPYSLPRVWKDTPTSFLIHEIAPQIGSLDLNTSWNQCDLILSSFLPKCKPGVLKTLTTYYDGTSGLFFATPNVLPSYCAHYSKLQIGSSQADIDKFDQVLASLTTLRLTRFYPFWTSQAYHGLTELRLLRGDLDTHSAVISEDHLTGILRASPALQVLELSLAIVQALPSESPVSPISLEHLESLNVFITSEESWKLLRWIAPGPNPLQLAIRLKPYYHSDLARWPDNAVRSFFARSEVSQIYLESWDYTAIPELLDLCPRLETLACSGINLLQMSEEAQFFISHPTLESLLVLDSLVDSACLLNVMSGTPLLKRILFWQCYARDGKLESMVGCEPIVKVADYDPTRDWELFAPCI